MTPERKADIREQFETLAALLYRDCPDREQLPAGTLKSGLELLDALDASEREKSVLYAALIHAIDAAEMEGIDRYRGTDEPRAFVQVLRDALRIAQEAVQEPASDVPAPGLALGATDDERGR